METVYHYTSSYHLEQILQDGRLKVSKADRNFGIRPAVWFSKNLKWEPTATKMIFDVTSFRTLTEEEQLNSLGMVRFAVALSTEFISWRRYRHIGKIDPQLHSSMEALGLECGSKPDDWYCLLRNVPLSECISMESFDGLDWQSIPRSQYIYPSV